MTERAVQTQNLFGESVHIVPNDLQVLQDTSSREWAREAFAAGVIDDVMAEMMRGLNVSDNEGGLVFIDTLMSSYPPTTPLVTKSDLEGRTTLPKPKNVSALQNSESDEELVSRSAKNLHRQYGKRGHVALPDLVTGEITRDEQPTLPHPMFESVAYQLPPTERSLSVDDAIKNLQEMMKEDPYAPYRNYSSVRDLEDALRDVYGVSHIDALQQIRDGNPADHLYLLSLLSYGTFAQWAEGNGPKVLFREINAMDRKHNKVSGGVIDALEVTKIQGSAPDPEQQDQLRAMAEREIVNGKPRSKYTSVAGIVRDVRKTFGPDIQFRIWDWKLAVGDAVRGQQVIDLSALNEPYRDHRKQVEQYQMFAALDCYLGNLYTNGQAWHPEDHFDQANIMYIGPFSEPKIFDVSLSQDEKEAVFRQHVAARWEPAVRLAQVRQRHRTLLSDIQDMNSGEAKSTGATDIQITLPFIEQVIQKYRQYADPYTISEVIGKNSDGTPKLQFNFQRLLAGIESGNVKVGESIRQLGDGNVFISCINPEHDDSTPSMYVRGTESVQCYGCGMRGKIADWTVPEEYKVDAEGAIVITSRRRKEKLEFEVPLEHHQIMSTLQEALQRQFQGSAGEQYIASNRKLDPGLLYELGAGFGNVEVMSQLLEQGIDLDALFKYKILEPSGFARQDSPLVRLLLSHGYTYDDLLRRMGKRKDGQALYGLPSFKMADRVTFPLLKPNSDGIDLYTSFYGRATWDASKRAKHRKLSRGNVAHGVFNPTPFSNGADTIILTEGAIDAATLIQMGNPNTTAIIGTYNEAAQRLLIASGKDIGIALDNDAEGAKAAERFAESLMNLGFQGNVYNFTERFVEEHPDSKDYDDYNTYWINSQ